MGATQVKAYDDIEAAQRACDAALPITLAKPSPEAKAQGILVHFRYDGGDYEMLGDVSRGDAGLVVTRTEIQASQPSGVTTRLLRTAPLAEALNAVRAHEALEEARRRGTRAILGQEPAAGLFTQSALNIPETSGRTTITDDLLRTVAHAYLQETAPGKDRRAIQRLATRFDRPEGTVRTWISRARKEGWLGPGARGRMGAEPGPKLLLWLGDAITGTEAVRKEAAIIAKEWGITARGPLKAALIAYDDPAERELSHQMGLPPLETAVAAQALFGQALSAELVERSGVAGATPESALGDLTAEIRAAFNDRSTGTDN